MPPDVYLSAQTDYEWLYTKAPFFRRDLARFISHTLGQLSHHETLMAKPRTYFISTTFPDVHAALPNIDILTVGSDAVEIRVDLLKEPLDNGQFSDIPSLSYVGEQLMLLRQRTELPIIFTTRCTKENGLFPMENPDLFYEYLYRAIQWGVEYIDVELWLPEIIRRRLYEQRGSSRIMSAFHDFSGTFKWPSERAESIFLQSRRYADIVKMIAIINDHNENFELEYFRSKIKAEYPDSPPLSAVNMGETGQFSRTLNKVFTPITHPLLPIIAAPGQMSAAEINQALALVGQLPKKNIYGITSPSMRRAIPQAPFYEKCLNELGLPHHFAVVERQTKGLASIETWCNQRNFGGAYLNPAISLANLATSTGFFASLNNGSGPVLSEAARLIGMVDTIVVRPTTSSNSASTPSSPPRQQNGDPLSAVTSTQSGLPPNTSLVFDNASWKGILSTLTRDLAPSAYFGCAAVVLASSADDAASALFALKALKVGKVYTVGFKTPPAFAKDLLIEPFNSLESIHRARTINSNGTESIRAGAGSPFVVVSALGPEKSNLVGMLVRLFGSPPRGGPGAGRENSRRVFLDLADGSGQVAPRKGDPGLIAEQCGFAAYGAADVTAFTTVETLRLLVGQNVPYSFVRLASGRQLF
ncbi:type I 3-dehydroquinase-domain-containing protein [Triangularia verruculosa]|uniref:Type I 3-dehydroquinase-domain-containing protein n=1 Tax=Triangularia verruculosa TaxID=2587418 RepID=A0AAN7AU99_9PEZI|nr:type I 3-dehydroquinase-domain-containing protein [Triangularia verruculosa]